MKNSDNFCILPFTHLAVEANGDVKGCCLTPPFKKTNDQPFNLNNESLDDIKQNEDYKSFIEYFKKGKRHPYCSECWKLEDSGSNSQRINFNKYFHWKIPDKLKVMEASVDFIELKLGSNCNLKCLICGPHNSSSHSHEQYRIYKNPEVLEHIKLSSWIEKNETWSSNLLNECKSFHIMGGEPFLDKYHIMFIDELISSGKSKDISLWYNTNGTVINRELLDKLKHFKSIKISISVDDFEERFEFQRFPGKWSTLKKNIEIYQEYLSPTFIVKLDICWSILNILYIDKIVKLYEEELKYFFSEPETSPLAKSTHLYVGEDYCLQKLNCEQKLLIINYLDKISPILPQEYSLLLSLLTNHIRGSVDQLTINPNLEANRKERLEALQSHRGNQLSSIMPRLHFLLYNNLENINYEKIIDYWLDEKEIEKPLPNNQTSPKEQLITPKRDNQNTQKIIDPDSFEKIYPKCLSKNSLHHIGSDYLYYPCCYTHTSFSRNEFLKFLGSKKKLLNTRSYSRQEILSSKAWRRLIKSFKDKPLDVCLEMCPKQNKPRDDFNGRHGFKVLD